MIQIFGTLVLVLVFVQWALNAFSERQLTFLLPEKTALMQNVGNEANIWKAHSVFLRCSHGTKTGCHSQYVFLKNVHRVVYRDTRYLIILMDSHAVVNELLETVLRIGLSSMPSGVCTKIELIEMFWLHTAYTE